MMEYAEFICIFVVVLLFHLPGRRLFCLFFKQSEIRSCLVSVSLLMQRLPGFQRIHDEPGDRSSNGNVLGESLFVLGYCRCCRSSLYPVIYRPQQYLSPMVGMGWNLRTVPGISAHWIIPE